MKTLVRPPNWQRPAVAFLVFPLLLLTSAAVAPHLHLPVIEPARGTPVTTRAPFALPASSTISPSRRCSRSPGGADSCYQSCRSDSRRLSPVFSSACPGAAWHAPLDFSGGIGSNLALWVQVRLIYFIPIMIPHWALQPIGWSAERHHLPRRDQCVPLAAALLTAHA